MSVGNIGSGSDPSCLPNDQGNSQESSTSSKKTKSLWSKLTGSSENVLGKTTRSTTTQRKITSTSSYSSRRDKLGNLEEKTKSLSSSAKGFAETAGKLEEKYRKREGVETSEKNGKNKSEKGFLSSLREKFEKETTTSKEASGTSSSKTNKSKVIPGSSSSQHYVTRGAGLKNLEEKTKGLSSSAKGFVKAAEKLEEKYKKQADLGISKRLDDVKQRSKGFLSFIKGKFQISKKEETSTCSTSYEEVSSTLEDIEQLEGNIKENAETVESVNGCLDDCCACLKRLKSLFKRETHTREESKSSCYKKFKKSLLNIKENIEKATESIKNAVKKRVRLKSVSFRQQVYKKAIRELLKTSNLEDRAATALLGIKSLAQITGFDCKVEKNGLSFVPKSGETIFSSRLDLFCKLVDELLVEIDTIDPSKLESEEIQTVLEEAIKELSNSSNYFWHLFGLFS